MTRTEINKYLAAIVSTVAKTEAAPAGIVYAALNAEGVSHGDFCLLQTLLVDGGVCTLESDVFRLTDKGRHLAHEIDAAYARRAGA